MEQREMKSQITYHSPVGQTSPQNPRDSRVALAGEANGVSRRNPQKRTRNTAISMVKISGQVEKYKINGKTEGLKQTGYPRESAKPCLTT